MPLALHGIGVSTGCAIGELCLLERHQPEIPEYAVPPHRIEDEVQRFRQGLAAARQQLQEFRHRIPATVSAEVTAFIDTHLLMLEDSAFTKGPEQWIRTRHCNAEWALKLQRDALVEVFEAMDDPYLRTRKDDVEHVVRRILRLLAAKDRSGGELIPSHSKGRIIVADDLTPAETILMQHQGATALVTEHGGPLSHTAILARSLGIPAIVGVRHARLYLKDRELAVVDGQAGVLLAGLNETLLQHYRQKQQRQERQQQDLIRLKAQPAITRDQINVVLDANIELPEDVEAARHADAAGVGLYRTEFLFMNRATLPDEEEHLAAYRHVLKTLKGLPITIRTADLGADKQVDGGRSSGAMANNPALGLRGIRLCLRNLELFRPQLRAILRASAFGKVRMLIPMLSNAQELSQVLRLVAEAKQELQEEGRQFDSRLPVGAMVEVPAVAVCAAHFARQVDFLSIGTNDLIQYTLATDRLDDEVNYLYDPLHPAVLQLIYMTIRAGQKAGIPVSMCGEMAGDIRYTKLLLGLGLTHFSMRPASLWEVKRVVRESNLFELSVLAKRLLEAADIRQFNKLLQHLTGH